MALVERIWKDKAKGEVNPLAFSDLAQKMAQKVDIEGRDLLTSEENKEIKRKFKNKKDRDLAKEKLQKEKEKQMQKMTYEEWLIEKVNWKDKSNKPTQIRKFYNVIFDLHQRTKNQTEETKWNEIIAQLHRQLALVHYARGRNLVTNSFVNMLEELIKAIDQTPEQGKKDLEVVTNFLEAFMAYYKECRPSN